MNGRRTLCESKFKTLMKQYDFNFSYVFVQCPVLTASILETYNNGNFRIFCSGINVSSINALLV
jgi:hypothetical protein